MSIQDKKHKIKMLTDDELALERAKHAVTIDILYPVGIVALFAQSKDPNLLFPSTVWKYIGENKTIRLGQNILSTGGNDTITLTTGQLPPHNHPFLATTDSFDYGTKTTNSAGAHYHDSGWGESREGRYGYYDDTNGNFGSSSSDWDNYKYNTSTEGEHQHKVDIGSHSHAVSGTTSSTGKKEAIDITNAYIILMGWYRIE
ncbi:phage tail protein [Xenorhabdus sp. XENO-7]|uniref:Phage tail protein n=1 Tax=Xenorhabdus aichiensis TaxID=3025874 RepID=A0ABT5M5M5_9GAMM|nr:phage tail protein [Xenorhabdus aichiensis]MDC9622847.1 phage tail protein [Xenorhabdus aichiensis]